MQFIRLTLLVALVLGVADRWGRSDVYGQEAESAPQQPGSAPQEEEAAATQPPASADAQAAADKFATKFNEWRQLLEQLRSLRNEYQLAEQSQVPAMRQRWQELIQQGEQLVPELEEAAKQAYAAAPNQDRALTRFLAKLVEDAIGRDRYETAYDIATLLLENGTEIDALYDAAGIAAFAKHDFEKAEEYLTQANRAGVLSEQGQQLYNVADSYQELWKEEQELRKKDAESNLPRVKLQTSKGDIVVELFEDQAPETVGNFVSLVESGFYDGVVFHRVLPNFMAQTGDPSGDGTGGPGYNIYSEEGKPEARKHFTGSLSMANTGRPNSGGSQFFITFLPTPHLNGRHTVFGRVLEGMDVLPKLQRRDPSAEGELPEADKIIKAEVLRKRDHEYVPNKVQ